MYVFAKLDDSKLDTLKRFEESKGVKVLAFSEVEVAPARMDEVAVADLKDLEGRLGVTLVAYS